MNIKIRVYLFLFLYIGLYKLNIYICMNKGKVLKETKEANNSSIFSYPNLRLIKRKIRNLKNKNKIVSKILISGSTLDAKKTNNVLFIKALYEEIEEYLNDISNRKFLLSLNKTYIIDIIKDFEMEKSLILNQLTSEDIPEKNELGLIYKEDIAKFDFYIIVESRDVSALSYNQAMLLFTIIKFTLSKKLEEENDNNYNTQHMNIDEKVNPLIDNKFSNIADQIKNDILSDSESESNSE